MQQLTRFGLGPAVAVLAVIGASVSDPTAASLASAAGVVVLVVALVVRPLTGWPLIAALTVLLVLVAVACDPLAGNIGWFAVCVLAGWAGLVEPPERAATFGVLAVALFVVEQVALSTDEGWAAWIAGTAISSAGSMAGRREQQLVVQLRAAQAGLADRARSEERVRIAHELHDVIGHALTVSLLHVTSARLALAEDPAEAEASLAEAERLAQQSLAEVRAVVGLMQEREAATPMPGTAGLEDLVDSFRRAGTRVAWRVEGDLSVLTAAEGLIVYRIVQEALTNVARHAPDAEVEATVRHDDSGTRVVVDSDGPPLQVLVEGTGLLGMRQRAEAVGGQLTAGPGGTGWRVEAVLPSSGVHA